VSFGKEDYLTQRVKNKKPYNLNAMKILIERDRLIEELEIITSFASKTSKKDEYGIISFRLDNSQLILNAFTPDIFYSGSIKVDAKSDDKKEFFADAKTLLSLVRNLKKRDITIVVNETLNISDSEIEYKIPLISSDYFIPFEEIKPEKSFQIELGKLLDALSKVHFCTAEHDEVRLYLTGIHINSKGKDVDFVASNGHILGLYKLELDNELPTFKITIQEKLYDILKKIHSYRKNVIINFAFNEDYVVIEFQDTNRKIYSRLFSEAYPDYDRIIPKEFSFSFTTSIEQLKEKIKSIKVISPFTIHFEFEKDRCRIYAKEESEFSSYINGNAEQFVDNNTYKISFSFEQFSNLIKGIDDAYLIDIKIKDKNSPVMLSVNENKNFYLIMPIASAQDD